MPCWRPSRSPRCPTSACRHRTAVAGAASTMPWPQGRLDVDGLRATLARHVLHDSQPVYAVDLSVWPRCDAEASPERGFYYHPSRHSAGQPIVAGWAYQWLAQLSFTATAGPPRSMCGASIRPRTPTPSPSSRSRALVTQLPRAEATPLFVFDAGYDSAQLTQALAETPVAILVRLRADRCFYADPPPAMPSPKGGRPRKHGAKFACKDPATWPAPTAEHVAEDEQYGTVRVRAWAGLHPKQQAHPGRGTRKTRPIVRGTVVLVEVSRLPARPYPPTGAVAVVGWTGQCRIWTCCGGPTSGASTWSTRCASASRASAGRRRACATRSKPIAGRGWSWPPTPSCGWHDRGSPTVVCPGSGRWIPGKLTPSRVRRALSALLPMVGTPARRQNRVGARRVVPREPVGARSPLPGPEKGRVRRSFCQNSHSIRRRQPSAVRLLLRLNHKLRPCCKTLAAVRLQLACRVLAYCSVS